MCANLWWPEVACLEFALARRLGPPVPESLEIAVPAHSRPGHDGVLQNLTGLLPGRPQEFGGWRRFPPRRGETR